jgi:hypothetical protein
MSLDSLASDDIDKFIDGVLTAHSTGAARSALARCVARLDAHLVRGVERARYE